MMVLAGVHCKVRIKQPDKVIFLDYRFHKSLFFDLTTWLHMDSNKMYIVSLLQPVELY